MKPPVDSSMPFAWLPAPKDPIRPTSQADACYAQALMHAAGFDRFVPGPVSEGPDNGPAMAIVAYHTLVTLGKLERSQAMEAVLSNLIERK